MDRLPAQSASAGSTLEAGMTNIACCKPVARNASATGCAPAAACASRSLSFPVSSGPNEALAAPTSTKIVDVEKPEAGSQEAGVPGLLTPASRSMDRLPAQSVNASTLKTGITNIACCKPVARNASVTGCAPAAACASRSLSFPVSSGPNEAPHR
jgi:hypothetical protein